MNIRQCLNASFDGLFKSIGRIGMRKIYGGLDGGEDILGSVLGFAGQGGNKLVVPLSLSDVPGDFRRPDDCAFGILDRRDSQRNIDQACVLRR